MSLNIGIISSSYKAAAPSGGSLLLDLYPSAAAAFSFRKLRTAYSGSAIRVRRSSDNTQTDIGFVAGVLDTSSLLTFCGVSNGNVVTWYDQSGNNNNVTQTTATNQPQIVNAGTLNTQGTKPCVKFDGNDFMLNATNGVLRLDQRTHFLVARELTSVNYAGIISYSPLSGNDFNNANGGNVNAGDGTTYGNSALNISGTIPAIVAGTKPMPYRLLSIYGDTISACIQANNGTFNSVLHNYASNQFQTGKIHLGVRFIGSPDTLYGFNGVMQEVVMYNGNSQNANISGINTNINSFYSIY